MSGSKQPSKPSTRSQRRAADRQQDRFDAARGERRPGPGAPRRSGAPAVSSRLLTIGAVVVGLVIVAIAAYSQLSGRVTGTLVDPGIAYPASIQHDNELGSASAPVTLEVYEDFQCPYCAKSSLDTEPSLVSRYVMGGQLRIVHRDFVWVAQNADQESRASAAGAICAQRQGRYWEYAHWVYANQLGENVGSFTRDRLSRIAAAAGLDTTAFGSCVDAPDVLAEVAANTTAFTPIVSAHGGTPMFFLNGAFAAAGYQSPDAMGRLIDAALAGGSAAPATNGPETSASAGP